MNEHVGIYGYYREDIIEFSEQIVSALSQKGIHTYTISGHKLYITGAENLDKKTFLETIDIIIVIGGDGTFLRAANLVRGHDIPMLGINKGHLGFLSELEVDEFPLLADRIISGDYTLDERLLIKANVYKEGKFFKTATGLNDIVLNRHPMENTIRSEVYLDGQLVDRYLGDGLIIATPTGSTGYSLSAGGPLIFPGTNCFIVTPVSPHSLTTRAAIVPPDNNLTLVIGENRSAAYLSSDGQPICTVDPGDEIRLMPAEETIKLIHMRPHPFFTTVRNKLIMNQYREAHEKLDQMKDR